MNKQLNIIKTTLILSLMLLLSSESRAGGLYIPMSLQESINDINSTIDKGLTDFTEQTQESMEKGNTIIFNHYMGEAYKLSQHQVNTFNMFYSEGLSNSTREAVTTAAIDEIILDKQHDYEVAKESLIEAASDIAEVTEVAQIIATGNQEQVVNAQEYAVENDLVEIKQEDVQQYNTSIDSMLEASMTKNMIEAYSQDLQLVDTIAQAMIDTETTQAFFDTVTITIDELNHTALNVAWDDYSMTIEGDMYAYYQPIPDLEMMLR